MPVQGKKKLFGAAAIIVLTCLLAAPAMACWTPLEWQAKPVQWSRDQDQNGLDDTLDQLIVEDAEARAKAVAKEPAPVPITAPIVVNLTRCPQQADIDWLADYGTIVKMGRFVTFVAMDDVAVSDLPTIDGAVVWRSPPLYVSYASPIAIDVEGQEQIVFLSAEEVFGLDAGNGAVLWRSPCRNGFANNASDPVWNGDGLLWVASQPGDGHGLHGRRPADRRGRLARGALPQGAADPRRRQADPPRRGRLARPRPGVARKARGPRRDPALRARGLDGADARRHHALRPQPTRGRGARPGRQRPVKSSRRRRLLRSSCRIRGRPRRARRSEKRNW